MRLLSKPTALAAGMVAALAAVTSAQPPGRGAAPKVAASASEPLTIPGTIEWIEKSDVSALTEGVIDKIELREGMEVGEGKLIGSLHDEKARLTVAKAEVAANAKGAVAKSHAQRALAYATLARFMRLNVVGKGYVSKEEIDKAEAEVNVAESQIVEATDTVKVAQADLNLAKRALEEHTILSPFDGLILKVLKHSGETVRANEAVVRMGKVDRLRFYGFLPIENFGRVRPGMVVDIRPRVEDAEIPIEQKRFRGKVVAIGTEVQTIGSTEVEIYAEVVNNQAKDLRPGFKAEMTVYLDGTAVPAPPADMLPPDDQVAKASSK